MQPKGSRTRMRKRLTNMLLAAERAADTAQYAAVCAKEENQCLRAEFTARLKEANAARMFEESNAQNANRRAEELSLMLLAEQAGKNATASAEQEKTVLKEELSHLQEARTNAVREVEEMNMNVQDANRRVEELTDRLAEAERAAGAAQNAVASAEQENKCLREKLAARIEEANAGRKVERRNAQEAHRRVQEPAPMLFVAEPAAGEAEFASSVQQYNERLQPDFSQVQEGNAAKKVEEARVQKVDRELTILGAAHDTIGAEFKLARTPAEADWLPRWSQFLHSRRVVPAKEVINTSALPTPARGRHCTCQQCLSERHDHMPGMQVLQALPSGPDSAVTSAHEDDS
ncbi:unnamed protein product [Durusdinium trenchii]|uniref:Uncharacterized protein n=2 Tax=Durusdinium trenchii TaxID=1381693 RepID=A0ABP0RI27_9DINO